MSNGVRTALIAVAALLVGMLLGGHPDSLPGPIRDVVAEPQASTSAEALDQIEEHYFRGVNGDRLQDESVRGMVAFLRKRYKDRFSHYFDPGQFKQFEEVTQGEFSGVGLGVHEAKEGLRVSMVFDDSPAKRAGIKPGDVVTAVNDRPLAGVDATLATGLIKGPAGTEVRLSVQAGSGGKPRQVTLKRERLDVPVVDGKLVEAGGAQVAYVQLLSFTPGVHAELRTQIDELYAKGAEGLILDLRGNGGGLLEEAVLTGSLFVEDGVIVSTDGRTQPKHAYNAIGDALKPRPTVVLIDHDTASAAEILTAALQENGLATVVGTTSFGKGDFQQVIPLDDGGGLDLTVGEYLTSDGTSLAGKGIEPQVQVKDQPGDGDEVLDRGRQVLGAELGK
ncbi:MAG: S41 family peptidase [Solirubrobacterales bacterium]